MTLVAKYQKCPECKGTGEIVLFSSTVPCDCRKQPTQLTQDVIEKLLRQLFETPSGFQKIAASMRIPMELRHHYKSVARKVWGRFDEFTGTRGCALFADAVVDVDLSYYQGEDLAGEVLLPEHVRLGYAFDRAMDNIVKTVARLETERFFRLLRKVSGRQTVEAHSFDAGLAEILESRNLQGIILEAKQIFRLKQAKSPNRESVLSCGRPFLYGDQEVHLLVCPAAAGEVWAFSEGSGFADIDLGFDVLRDRIEWNANLKLAVVDPSRIFQVVTS